jgi:hypothetical protein
MKFVKTLQCTYEIHHGMCETELGKEKVVTEDCKGMLVENYICHGCCFSWEKPCE